MQCSQSRILQPMEGNVFSFACHKNVSCFTECCRDLNLLLTPYDIIRLKNHLAMDSGTFLKTYTRTEVGEEGVLPLVFLAMGDDERKTCPFVTPEGCSVYEHRPGACRTYPLGRASARVKGQKKASEKYFVVKEQHCKGFEEDRTWTVQEWLDHEGLNEYNARNDDWTDIITTSHSFLKKHIDEKKLAMFFMASYNLDMFRRFVFESSFLDRFAVTEEEKARMREDDIALLDFALKWIRFFLLGEPSLKMNGGK